MRKVDSLPDVIMGKGEVKGFVFTKAMESDYAFIYEVDCGRLKNHYEVFKKKAKTNSVRYCYPTSKAFGFWAWCPMSFEKAMKIFNEINNGIR